MSVVEWSDAHKLRALQKQVDTMKEIAAGREALIARQARTIAQLYVKLCTIDSVAREGLELLTTYQPQQQETSR